jgi:hypothetical protein
MENFNLRKFLAEGRLFEDEILPDDPIANKSAEVVLLANKIAAAA